MKEETKGSEKKEEIGMAILTNTFKDDKLRASKNLVGAKRWRLLVISVSLLVGLSYIWLPVHPTISYIVGLMWGVNILLCFESVKLGKSNVKITTENLKLIEEFIK